MSVVLLQIFFANLIFLFRSRTRSCYVSSSIKHISRVRYLRLLVVKDSRCLCPSAAAVLGHWINLLFEFSRKFNSMFLSHHETGALTFSVAFREGGVSSSPLNMRDRGGATNLLLTGRDGASDIRSVRDCACVKK